MKIDSIKNGIVIDHITAGRGMEIYNLLHLGDLNSSVAIIKNVTSNKMGKKDIIKIDEAINVDFDILGYVDPGVTIDVIKDSEVVAKHKVELPQTLTNVLFCKNPRCITQCEQELDHVFKLTDKDNKVYRCIYCETKAKD